MIKKRAEILDSCIRLLQRINSEISYNAEPLQIIISKVCRCHEFDKLVFLHKMSRSYCENIILCWRECVEKFSETSPITKSDKELLISFGEKLGTTDIEHQQKLCDEYISLFKQRYDSLQKNQREHIKLCKVCSFALGAVMLILLM